MTPESLLTDLLSLVVAWFAANSWLLWAVAGLAVAGFVVFYYFERDAQDASQRVAGGFATAGVAVVALVTGFAEGLGTATGPILDVLAPHADLLGQLLLAGAGWSALRGGFMDNLATFGVFAVLIIGVSYVWGE